MVVLGIRQLDLDEMKATSGSPPEEALMRSLRVSTKAWAYVHKGAALSIFGVAPWPGTPTLGSPWMISTDLFNQHSFQIARFAKQIVRDMGEGFDFLVNYVDIRQLGHLPWREWAGFQFDEFIPEFGVERRPFLRFSKAT
jgi:hypothetical protein